MGKDRSSIIRFLQSNAFKVLLGKAPEFYNFAVENAQKLIVGIPPEIANLYWIDQLSKGNLRAIALVSAFSLSSLEHYADLEFGINRTKVEQVQRLQELFWRTEPGDRLNCISYLYLHLRNIKRKPTFTPSTREGLTLLKIDAPMI